MRRRRSSTAIRSEPQANALVLLQQVAPEVGAKAAYKGLASAAAIVARMASRLWLDRLSIATISPSLNSGTRTFPT